MRNWSAPAIGMALAAWVFGAGSVSGQYRQIGSVHDGAGGLSDNAVHLAGREWRHVGSAAQPGGVFPGVAGRIDHRAGFLQAVEFRRLDLDADGDGMPDEMDPDNDGDGLGDVAEVDGSAFQGHASTDPNDPDTDGDGMGDAAEALGMYDPLDPEHRLEILDLGWAPSGDRRLTWIGKGGGTFNLVYTAEDLAIQPFTNVMKRNPYMGGDPPWYKTTNSLEWPEAPARRFFQVRTEP